MINKTLSQQAITYAGVELSPFLSFMRVKRKTLSSGCGLLPENVFIQFNSIQYLYCIKHFTMLIAHTNIYICKWKHIQKRKKHTNCFNKYNFVLDILQSLETNTIFCEIFSSGVYETRILSAKKTNFASWEIDFFDLEFIRSSNLFIVGHRQKYGLRYFFRSSR